MQQFSALPGKPYPLGSTYDGNGVNFALFSENAWGVELSLFDENNIETQRIKISERTHNHWHIYITGLKPNQRYGYRVSGPYNPSEGHRFNAHKLLIDPYAKALSSKLQWNNAIFGYLPEDAHEDLSFSNIDSAPFVPKSVVYANDFNWEGDVRPSIPLHKTIVYELNVKGFTKLFSLIPEELRGTYSGMAHPEVIKYLKTLGVNAVELMPIHQFINDRHLVANHLSNYWGYNSINYFTPHLEYAAKGTGDYISEFKEMVKALHKEGIEIILDVVYNHTGESNQLGPTMSFRGIDNAAYYRLDNNKRFYKDFTGTGNTLNMTHPSVMQMVIDSLRYWITEMHVDGFRFDLATVLARQTDDYEKNGTFFNIIHQDPILAHVKLIGEPWDLGYNGYQIGNFPAGWMEWNGKFRDCVRNFWNGSKGVLPEFAARITGSSDVFNRDWRRPTAGVNFVTAHDGFTLNDLVSYNHKHNHANKEHNRDGESHNSSWNCGVEGNTDNAEIVALRNKQTRNFLTTLFLSQGIPMLVAGDEFGRTQHGNNNAYCQDNELSWLHWAEKDEMLIRFTASLISIRKNHPVFCRDNWFENQVIDEKSVNDIEWFHPQGSLMTTEDWQRHNAKSVAVYLSGNGVGTKNEFGETIKDNSFLLILNGNDGCLEFQLPENKWGKKWAKIIDTHTPFDAPLDATPYSASQKINIESRSIILLKEIE